MKASSLRPLRVSQAHPEFIARGLASAARARDSGRYVPADAVLGKLARRLASAKAKRICARC